VIYDALLLLQLVSTWSMVGVIWFVQLVHYPLFAKVDRAKFPEFQAVHVRRTTWIVAPLMITEAATAFLLPFVAPGGLPRGISAIGAVLVVALWLSTFVWQVPTHDKLMIAFDQRSHRDLVRSNWLRTALWTVRAVLVCWLCLLAA